VSPSFGRIPHKTRPDSFSEHTPSFRQSSLTRIGDDAVLLLDVFSGADPRAPFALADPTGTFLTATDRSTMFR